MTVKSLTKLDDLVKVFCFIPRKKGMSEPEFHRYWRHPHGTLATKITSVRRYIQSHKIGVDHGFRDAPHDGVAELWFDSLHVANTLNEDPNYADHCGVDEWNFIDIGKNTFRVVVEERVVREGQLGLEGRGIKLLQLMRRPDGMSVEDYNAHWSMEQEALLAEALGTSELIACPATADNYGLTELPPQGALHHWQTLSPYDGIREIWWPDLGAFERARNSAAWEKLSKTMPLNSKTSAAMLVEEIVVVDGPSGFVAAAPVERES